MKKENDHLIKISVMFVTMILLTLIAFYIVYSEWISNEFLPYVLIFLAMIQVVIQLILFMDIKEKEGRYRITSVAAGGFIAVLTIFFLAIL
ncbi:cytochrome C oxidase subunit IV family protein [Alkalihalobacillus sp. CinArs1]|uniref:cytochrome C oxidase subunit IV family protein n=1 Tax=Alkalihalobacillus sp. CinArs1 TaxID=2995314 RepID=UPI0022DDBD7B|nr:cytochrome C oxidase subunit IV family protein [Alkalihalobacillus sp. CinArs1]